MMMGTRESMVLQGPGSIHSMQSPRSQRVNQQFRGGAGLPATDNSLIPSHVKMAQDRSAYMTFLEVQLERVTQACNNAVANSERVDGMQV